MTKTEIRLILESQDIDELLDGEGPAIGTKPPFSAPVFWPGKIRAYFLPGEQSRSEIFFCRNGLENSEPRAAGGIIFDATDLVFGDDKNHHQLESPG